MQGEAPYPQGFCGDGFFLKAGALAERKQAKRRQHDLARSSQTKYLESTLYTLDVPGGIVSSKAALGTLYNT